MTFSPRFRITNATNANLVKIERVRGFLEGAKLSEDWVKAMAKEALILEAHSTTHIEGNPLTLEQSERVLTGQPVPEADPDHIKELLNYKAAFDLVADELATGQPITDSVICRIHARLVEGVKGDAAGPGRYRAVQNYVINDATNEVIYTPPPPGQVGPMMTDLVTWLQAEQETPPVLVAGIAQFQLVHIHPFRDGNGRTARLLSTLCLYRAGYDFKRLFTVSEYYDQDRPTYYDRIKQAEDLDLTYWLEYFTEGVATQMHDVQAKGETAIRRDVVLARARRAGLKERPITILRFLLERGRATISECESELGQNRRTLQRDLKVLAEEGFVREIGTGPTDPTRYYEPLS